MSREQIYQSFIIKKQALGEADEIITLFTRERGKIRAKAKSVKFSRSKLQQSLQLMFYTAVNVSETGGLPIITGALTRNVFRQIQTDPDRIAYWYAMAELLHKALADEQPNPLLFDMILGYLAFLDNPGSPHSLLRSAGLKFKIEFFDLIGLCVHAPMVSPGDKVLFSASRGGFYVGAPSADSQAVAAKTWELFEQIKRQTFIELSADGEEGVKELQGLLTAFTSYQLERELKSERFIK
jgi:DNA repair protein RecO (recombination protein O)